MTFYNHHNNNQEGPYTEIKQGLSGVLENCHPFPEHLVTIPPHNLCCPVSVTPHTQWVEKLIFQS
jgi:hypothetical protein